MKDSTMQWDELTITPEIEALATELQQPEWLAALLAARGIHTKEEATAFLHPSLEALHSPYDLHDMEKAKQRILEAIESGESMLIYGDYDCDGITSSTVLKEAIESFGGEAQVFLPNRVHDGYGPNKDVYEYFIDKEHISLIITVDNGITGFEAIEYATEHGCDVIVTDHHELKETLPNAYAIVHPRHPEGHYPFGELAGVGVAFKLACALMDYVPTELLDVVAIGTVADLVPLRDENRILVKYGLSVLQQTDRIGLRKLVQAAGLELNHITEETIAFQIAPRLNALGRMEEAGLAVTLLTTFDDEEAEVIAQHIEEVNQQRKDVVARITEEALAMVNPDSSIQVLASSSWHEGVLGIVASKIVEVTKQPAFVLTINEETHIAKGSGRSVPGVNIVTLLEEAAPLLTTFGGHAAAAGLSLEEDKLPAFREQLEKSMAEHAFHREKERVMVEALPIKEATLEHEKVIQQLAPFGQGNSRPLFKVTPDVIRDVKLIGQTQSTIKAVLEEEGHALSALQFQYHDSWREWLSGKPVELVGELAVNEWNGNQSIQFRVKDYRIPSVQVFDGRMQRIEEEDFMKVPSLFVYFDPYHAHRLQKMFPSQRLMYFEDINTKEEQIVICDVPSDLNQLKRLIQQKWTQRYVVMCRAFEEALLNGMPTRDDFARLFRFIAQYREIDVVHRLQDIAHFVKIPLQNLIFMINLFKKLGFVTINNGILNRVENPKKQSLENSPLYKAREQLIENESFLLYSDIETLIEWFQQQEEQKEL